MRNEAAMAVLGATIPVLSAYSFGAITCSTRVPHVLRLAFGSALLSLLLFLLMIARAASPTVVLGVCSLLVVAAVARGRLHFNGGNYGRPGVAVALALGGYTCLYLVAALSPELQTDALNYHLQAALDANRYGGFSPVVDFYNRLPQGAELLYVPAYQVGGAKACKLVHLIFLLATIPAMLILAELLHLPSRAAWTGACLYFLSPVVGVSGTSAMNDCMLVFFSVAVVVWGFRYRQEPNALDAFRLGAMAGMCYAIKITGGLAFAFACGYLWAKGTSRWQASAAFLFGAALVAGPWLVRNKMETGNPVAPFFNAAFPNPFFYSFVEQSLSSDLKNYGVPPPQMPVELLKGHRLQGIIGPIFVLTPLVVFFLRRRNIRALLAYAFIFGAAWWLNAGTRFLMPALPFVCLAIVGILPRIMLPLVLLVHAALSWPSAVERLDPYNWRIRDYSWQSAVGLQTSDEYLRENSWDYRVAKMVESRTGADAVILDLMGLHRAFVDRRLIGPWQSASGFQARNALEFGHSVGAGGRLIEARFTFPRQAIRSIVLQQKTGRAQPWSVAEAGLWDGYLPVVPGFGSASINRWDLPLLFDGNVVSRWSTWRGLEASDYVDVAFGAPVTLSRVTLLVPAPDTGSSPELILTRLDASTFKVAATMHEAPELQWRIHAVSYLKRLGIEYILVSTLDEGLGMLGKELVADAAAWKLSRAGQYEWVHLLKLATDDASTRRQAIP